MAKFKDADDLLRGVDPQLFRQQRVTLLEMAYGNPAIPTVAREDLQGLVTLTDHLADYMADVLDMKEVLLASDPNDDLPSTDSIGPTNREGNTRDTPG